MEHDKHFILGVHIHDRMNKASDVQNILTEYGCHIKTRLGLHEVSETKCAATGILIMEMTGDETKIKECASKLDAIEGIDVKQMIFEH